MGIPVQWWFAKGVELNQNLVGVLVAQLLNQSPGASPVLEQIPAFPLALGVDTSDYRLWGL
tara:strand:- start:90 stop:272 length:183 start_codon:yes stop_codon:yes gene_type:complete